MSASKLLSEVNKADSCEVTTPGNMNLGVHIATRLVEIGVTDCFAVPGDFNLLLLDQLLKHPKLNMVWCCNELNAGYAADGYARKKGVGCMVTTFCVGGFSVFNAVAGAYSEDLPIIVISGGPNTNDFASSRTLHHTTGVFEFGQQYRCFREITCHQAIINDIDHAYGLIDEAISTALLHSKPVYLEVSCNIAAMDHPSFTVPPVPYVLEKKHTNHHSLMAAVELAACVLNKAVKPVLLAGVRLKIGKASQPAFLNLANKSHYATAVMPDAKGLFPESHERYIGTYWGAVSSPFTCEIVESSDVVVTVGAVWTDYSTVGYSLLVHESKMIKVEENRVTICGGKTFGCIHKADFLNALADAVRPNEAAYNNYKRMYVAMTEPPTQPPEEELHTNVLFKHIQYFLTPDMAVIAEVGDSWFNSQKLKLPDGCGYEMQMRYGSIGWSVGATLGYAMACGTNKRVLALIGDGSFQMTAQEVSTMMRFGVNPVIILINNGGYTIEVEIHDGPYNNIVNWDYTAFAESLRGETGEIFTAKAKTEPQLVEALAACNQHTDRLCFIEVFVNRDDCSKDLLEWGARVAAANSRPPVKA